MNLPAWKLLASRQPLIIGHRGVCRFAPENTPPPFKLAEALDTIQKGGVTLIERKAGAPADCINLLREKRLINHVIVQLFDWDSSPCSTSRSRNKCSGRWGEGLLGVVYPAALAVGLRGRKNCAKPEPRLQSGVGEYRNWQCNWLSKGGEGVGLHREQPETRARQMRNGCETGV
jgi:hypothetical protein